jgi:hypothetical protein
MGLDAQLIAVGPFARSLLSALEYPADFYADVPEGATIVSTVFEALTSAGSHLLARCLGVGSLELGRHAVGSAPDADVSALLADEEFAEQVPAFLALREAGFQFYYLPRA